MSEKARIQSSQSPVIEPNLRGVLDRPAEPVIGRRLAPIHWRMMTRAKKGK
jgi:hypothetical protein